MDTRVDAPLRTAVEVLLADFNEGLRLEGVPHFELLEQCPPADRPELLSLMNIAVLAYYGLRREREKQASAEPAPAPRRPVVTLALPDPFLLSEIRKKPELLRSLEGRAFEITLARLLEEQGYEVELQRGTKDGGVDLFFVRRDSIMGPHRYLLQAKRWRNAVGVDVVREILYLHQEHRVTKSCLAITSRFTRGAWKLGESHLWELELRDFDGVLSWLNLARVGGPRTPNS
jgi:hypothetical protein